MVQAVWLPFLFIPIMSASLSKVPGHLNNDASAITNLARNMGGSVGIAFTTTLLAYRTQFHHARLAEHVTPYNGFAGGAGLARIDRVIQGQAAIQSYLDVFTVMAMVSAFAVVLALMLPKVAKGIRGAAH
jgi:DHA2 family multidrug resistance protein